MRKSQTGSPKRIGSSGKTIDLGKSENYPRGKEMNEQELEWVEYLIGKIDREVLCSANKLRLEQQEAVREAQKIVGDFSWWSDTDVIIL